jgi:hypothetical protein
MQCKWTAKSHNRCEWSETADFDSCHLHLNSAGRLNPFEGCEVVVTLQLTDGQSIGQSVLASSPTRCGQDCDFCHLWSPCLRTGWFDEEYYCCLMLLDFAKEHCVSEKDLTLRAFASLLRLALKMKLSVSHWYNDTDRDEKPKHSEDKAVHSNCCMKWPDFVPGEASDSCVYVSRLTEYAVRSEIAVQKRIDTCRQATVFLKAVACDASSYHRD